MSVLEHKTIDIMISDVIMPGIDGYQLAATVKEKYPDIEIQLVSGFSDSRNLDTVDKKLRQSLLLKPVDSQILLKRICKLLDKHE
jgi:YesN/AraC family two-component response regulator